MGDSYTQSPCLHCGDPPSNISIPPKHSANNGETDCYSRKKNCCQKQCGIIACV